VPLLVADGNNVLDIYAAAGLAADRCRSGEGPVFVEARTFRMGGHATHDVREGRRTFAAELFEHWGHRDPIGLYEEFLVQDRVALGGDGGEATSVDPGARNRSALAEIETEVIAEVDRAAAEALDSRGGAMPEGATAAKGVYAPVERAMS